MCWFSCWIFLIMLRCLTDISCCWSLPRDSTELNLRAEALCRGVLERGVTTLRCRRPETSRMSLFVWIWDGLWCMMPMILESMRWLSRLI